MPESQLDVALYIDHYQHHPACNKINIKQLSYRLYSTFAFEIRFPTAVSLKTLLKIIKSIDISLKA